MTWNPIETAPCDRLILVMTKVGPMKAFWDDNGLSGPAFYEWDDDPDGYFPIEDRDIRGWCEIGSN